MDATFEDVTKNEPEPTAGQKAAEELVRRVRKDLDRVRDPGPGLVPEQDRPGALWSGMDGPGRWAMVEANRLHDRERRGLGEDLYVGAARARSGSPPSRSPGQGRTRAGLGRR